MIGTALTDQSKCDGTAARTVQARAVVVKADVGCSFRHRNRRRHTQLAAHGGGVLRVVRYFNSPDGVEETGAIGPGGLAKMSGQHQLLGWHLNTEVIDFMTAVGVELNVDEYG